MTFDWTSSRRTFLRTIVVSAVVSAAPFSVLEAATQNGEPAIIDLPNGSRLRVKKVGGTNSTLRHVKRGARSLTRSRPARSLAKMAKWSSWTRAR